MNTLWFRQQRFMIFIVCLLCCTGFPVLASATDNVVNIYAWTNEVPDFVVRLFEKETGIKVNISTYENNEIMYAKMRATKNPGYDLVMPSGYFVDRMVRQGLLDKFDKTKLPNWKNLGPAFTHPQYDPNTEYSMPYIWGITGIFVNSNYYDPASIKKWSDLWKKEYDNQLLLLDDTREVFGMGLIALGYSSNDHDKDHIKAAFLKLKMLMKNVKMFSTDTVIPIMIDEDASIGMAWNGDAYKAAQENPHIKFIFPEDGFVIWVDNFSIPHHAPHKENAYRFMNFLLRPDIAKQIAIITNFPITNLAGQNLLPPAIRNDPTIYPSKQILARGKFQTDVGDDVLALYERYWEELKLSG